MARRPAGGGIGALTFNWRLLVLVLSAFLVLIFTCSQLVILGNDCRTERERAVHAEDGIKDLLLQSQAVSEQHRQGLEKQIEQLRLKDIGAADRVDEQFRELELLRKENRQLKAEQAELRKENARLKASPIISPAAENQKKVIDRSVPAAMEITEETLQLLASKGAIGVAIISCKRPKYLQRAMESIFRAPRDPATFPLIISQDAHDAAMQELVQKNYVRTGQAY
eukprot:g6842.t1